MNGFFVRFALVFGAVFGLIFLAVWFYLSIAAPVEAGDENSSKLPGALGESAMFAQGQMNIKARGGLIHEFQVEFATNPAQQRRGLMFREHLEYGHGMLFDFTPPRPITMWMKNTPISLDMLFANAEGRVMHIATYTEPFSQSLIHAPVPVRYVLEVPAGTVKALDLRIGDHFQIAE